MTGDTHKKNTRSFVSTIHNGWLHTPHRSINKVFETINKMILDKETESETIKIFHAKETKTYIEEITGFGIELKIHGNTVCGSVKVFVNINYDELTDGEYYQLRRTIKKNQ
jgi:hypothetical protein